MAGLPENWEWDYDGKRWFYRYKPTGLIQYTFPKPGDEFPEFIDDTAAPLDLAPEEKLVSQQQIKRRSTLGQSSSLSRQSTATTTRERASSNAVSDPDDAGAPFWLQPDGLMYMGPGAYTDISPLQEEEEELGQGPDKAGAKDIFDPSGPTVTANTSSPGVTTATTAATTAEGTPSQGTPQPTRSEISPLVSTANTPHVLNSKPATATPELDSAVTVEAHQSVAVDVAFEESPEIHMLDSRQVPYNPIGVVAELASELTARCDDEINPAPVELPGNEIMMDVSEPVVYANAFHLAPVELPSDEASPKPKVASNAAEPKSLAPHTSGRKQDQEQQQRAYRAAQELLNRPYKPVRQNSMPQPTNNVKLPPSNPASGPTPGQHQPYNPARHAVLGAAAANRYSVAETQHRQLAGDNKRHSLAGPVVPQFRLPPDIPPALQAPQVPPKRPLDSYDAPQMPPKRPLDFSEYGGNITTAGPGPRPESVSGPITKGNSSGLTHFPSILQPARGRPVIRAQSPPQSQGASPARTYQAYKPYRDLQKDIEETVQLLSQTGYGQKTTAAPQTSSPGRPQVSSTPPTHVPTPPYMALRPQLPHSTVSEPAALRGLQSHQAPPAEVSASIPTGGNAGTAVFQAYSAPLPPSSPDLPPPLNLSRKSPPPPHSVPAATPFSPPVAAEPQLTFREAAPAILSAPTVSASVTATSGQDTVTHMGSLGATGNTRVEAGQAGATAQQKLATAPSPPHQAVGLEGTEGTGQMATPRQQPQTVDAPPGQAASSGFSVMVESAVPPASQAAASPQQVPIKSGTSNQQAPATSFAVEVPASMSDTQNAPIATHVPAASQSAPPGTLLAEPHTVITPSTFEVVVQASQPISSPPSSVASEVAQSSSHVVSDYQPVVEVFHQPSPQPKTMPAPDQTAQSQVPCLPDASTGPPAAVAHIDSLSSSANELDTKRAATPPQSSVTPQPPNARTPSPLYRASSSPTQQGHVPHNIASVSPPEAATTSSQQNPAPASPQVLNQGVVHYLPSGQGPLIMGSPPKLPTVMSAVASTSQEYSLPSGHHPFGSHPVSVSEPAPTEPSQPKPEDLGGNSSSQQPSSEAPVQSLPVAQPQVPAAPPVSAVTQSIAGGSQAGGTSAQEQVPPPQAQHSAPSQCPSTPASSPPVAQQAAASPAASSAPNQGHSTHPPVPQALPPTGQNPASAQPAGQTSQMPPKGKATPLPFGPGQMPPVQGKSATLPFGPGQTPQNAPQRTFSHPVVSQPGPLPHPEPSGSAPPQMPMMFAPPGMPQGVQPGMPPQHYAVPPGMVFQPGMQGQPVPPHMMQPGQMLSGSAYVMQQTQPAQPVKEEKSWFGKLWRSESLRKPVAGNAANSTNKLQKAPRPHAAPVFPPQLQPNQPVLPPQFAPPGTQMPPHVMMYPVQQAQQAPGMQQQQQHQQGAQAQPQPGQQPTLQFHSQQQQAQQHQQQQPLVWKTSSNGNGNGNGQGNSMPQFHAPNQNPNRPVVPPPQVRQAIQQQEQHLKQVHRQSMGLGQGQPVQEQSVQGGQQVAPAVQVQGQRQGQGQGRPQSHGQNQTQVQGQVQGGQAAHHGGGSQSQANQTGHQGQPGQGPSKAAPAAAVAPAGNAGASRWGHSQASGYDGSGWGESDEEDYS